MKKTIKAWAGFLDGKISKTWLDGDGGGYVLPIYKTRKDAKYESNGVPRYADLRRVEITFDDGKPEVGKMPKAWRLWWEEEK